MTWRTGTVTAVRPETSAARSIGLRVAGWPGHEAGQHVDVRLTAEDGYTATRSYSIASAPDGDQVEITVERVPDGEVSPYLVDEIAPGDQVEVRGPIGGWFVWRPTQSGPVLLIGGGSGLVPLMSILRRRRQVGSAAPVRLVYSVRGPDSLLYRDELGAMAAAGLRVTYVFTRRAPEAWPRPPGRLDAEVLADATFDSADHATSYVCGPTGFVEAAASLLLEGGHDPRRIRTERFGPTGGS